MTAARGAWGSRGVPTGPRSALGGDDAGAEGCGRTSAPRAPTAPNPGGLMRPERPPPFPVGRRVRCVVTTAEELGGLELLGRVGTVETCAAFGSPGDRGRDVLVVWVVWDDLPPRMLVHHDPEELAPADA